MKLHELMDKDLLTRMYEAGYVNLQVHPREPLGILNYDQTAAWEGMWNDVTRKCRGLIYDMRTMEVLARPFEKFFNYEQLDSSWVMPFGRVEVTDKQDGSLGILYPLPDGTWAVATRGSFASDQAVHATHVLNTRYADDLLGLDPGVTYLFEIIYPENRIVLNYGDMDDLVLLGGVVIETGYTFGPDVAQFMLCWPGPVAETFSARTFEQALALPMRDNAEGVVVMFNTGERVKIKQADYVALHRVVTGTTDRTIWEALVAGKSSDEIKAPLPEEFHAWVDEVVDGLFQKMDQILMTVYETYLEILTELGDDFTRKDFAFAVKDVPYKAYLFKYLDGQSIADVVLKSLKPAAIRSMVTQTSEDE